MQNILEDNSTHFGHKDIVRRFIPPKELVPFIDWTPFFHFWNFKGIYPAVLENREACEVYEAAVKTLEVADDIEVSCILRFFDTCATEDDTFVVRVPENGCACGCVSVMRSVRLPMLRQQEKGSKYECLTDFLPLKGSARMGLFCVKVQDHLYDSNSVYHPAEKDEYTHLLRDALCARLADACATWLEKQSGSGDIPVIRPSFGYPASPDHSLKKEVFDVLHVEATIGATLTESYSVIPPTSIVGLMIAHPHAHYFGIGKTGKDQWDDYRRRRGLSEKEMQRLLPY
jgi:5-methyltetrahydrofolate--homocysteine methyltransferase